jgi:hypothetical protein
LLWRVPGVLELFKALVPPSWADWGWLMYLAFPASIMNYTLTNYALQLTRRYVVSAYVFIQPIVAAVLGFFVLEEPITLIMLASGLMVGVGLMLVCGVWPLKRNDLQQKPLSDAPENLEWIEQYVTERIEQLPIALIILRADLFGNGGVVGKISSSYWRISQSAGIGLLNGQKDVPSLSPASSP